MNSEDDISDIWFPNGLKDFPISDNILTVVEDWKSSGLMMIVESCSSGSNKNYDNISYYSNDQLPPTLA